MTLEEIFLQKVKQISYNSRAEKNVIKYVHALKRV